MAYIEAVKRRVPLINAVLLSYADIPHLGALPYLVRKCGLNCLIYATVRVFHIFYSQGSSFEDNYIWSDEIISMTSLIYFVHYENTYIMQYIYV